MINFIHQKIQFNTETSPTDIQLIYLSTPLKKFQLKLLNKNLHIQPQLGYINKTQQKLTKINHDIQKLARKIKLKSRFALKQKMKITQNLKLKRYYRNPIGNISLTTAGSKHSYQNFIIMSMKYYQCKQRYQKITLHAMKNKYYKSILKELIQILQIQIRETQSLANKQNILFNKHE